MNLIEFKEATYYSLDTSLSKVCKGNEWYLIGDGILVTNLTEKEADELKSILIMWLSEHKKIN
jgi:hypothetical protein